MRPSAEPSLGSSWTALKVSSLRFLVQKRKQEVLSTPRVIFKCPHIKGGGAKAAAHLSNYVSYISTREGVERVDPGQASKPATKKQLKMVERLLREFPSSRSLFEYEDFLAAQTRGNASEFNISLLF